MLQESFERVSTQILSLYALSKYLASKPALGVSRSVCVHVLLARVSVVMVRCLCADVQWQEERIMGASLMLAGLKQENSAGFSARLWDWLLLVCMH